MVTQHELLVDDPVTVEHDSPSRQLAEQPATNPLMLLQQAVERGMSPEQLRALVDLHEQWRAARARESFAVAMNAVQAELPVIVRDAENNQTRSRYVRLETITHQAKPVYTSHGFALSFSEEDSTKDGFKRIVCLVRHREGHSEKHWLDLPIDGIGPKGNPVGGMNAVQGCISTGSYGQRVLTCRVFNITIADTDLDGVPPPEFANPSANQSAPRAQPRGKRETNDHPLAVNVKQLKHLTSQWQAKHPDPDGNLARQREAFSTWAREATKRSDVFDPSKISQWSIEDYQKCCDAIGCPTLEDLEAMQ